MGDIKVDSSQLVNKYCPNESTRPHCKRIIDGCIAQREKNPKTYKLEGTGGVEAVSYEWCLKYAIEFALPSEGQTNDPTAPTKSEQEPDPCAKAKGKDFCGGYVQICHADAQAGKSTFTLEAENGARIVANSFQQCLGYAAWMADFHGKPKGFQVPQKKPSPEDKKY